MYIDDCTGTFLHVCGHTHTRTTILAHKHKKNATNYEFSAPEFGALVHKDLLHVYTTMIVCVLFVERRCECVCESTCVSICGWGCACVCVTLFLFPHPGLDTNLRSRYGTESITFYSEWKHISKCRQICLSVNWVLFEDVRVSWFV